MDRKLLYNDTIPAWGNLVEAEKTNEENEGLHAFMTVHTAQFLDSMM